MNFVVCARGLAHELVAWNVDDFEALVVEVRVHLFDRLVVRGESATGCRVHDEHDFALEFREWNFVAFTIGKCEVVDCHNFSPYTLFCFTQLNFIKFNLKSQ